MNAIQKVLCSIDDFLGEFRGKWAKEFQEINSSLKKVSNTGQVPQKIAGRNPRRTEIWICNAGDAPLFIAPYVGEIDRDLYSLPLEANDTIIINSSTFAHLHKQEIQGFWDATASDDSKAMITEFYLDE